LGFGVWGLGAPILLMGKGERESSETFVVSCIINVVVVVIVVVIIVIIVAVPEEHRHLGARPTE